MEDKPVNNYAEVWGGYEFHLVGVDLFITPQENPDMQIKLSYEAIEGMLGYLNAMGAIAGRVKLYSRDPDGACVYRLALENRDKPEETIKVEMVVFNGKLEEVRSEWASEETAEDKGE